MVCWLKKSKGNTMTRWLCLLLGLCLVPSAKASENKAMVVKACEVLKQDIVSRNLDEVF